MAASTLPSYGDVLGRPADDPDRDEIRATPGWSGIALPGRPGVRRELIGGEQVDVGPGVER